MFHLSSCTLLIFFFAWDFSWLKLLWRFYDSTISTCSTLCLGRLDQQTEDVQPGEPCFRDGWMQWMVQRRERRSCPRTLEEILHPAVDQTGRRDAGRKPQTRVPHPSRGCLKCSLSCSNLVMFSVSALLWCVSQASIILVDLPHQKKERALYTKYTYCEKKQTF